MKNLNKLKQLFSAVQNKGNLPLSVIFNQFAVKWNLKKNSVRNFYYLSLKHLKDDKNLASKIGVNIDEIQNYKIIPFKQSETKQLIEFIDEKRANGYSIRKACIELANYDANLMLRYQNKYRAIKVKSKKTLAKSESKLQKIIKEKSKKTNKNTIEFSQMPDNVIPFKRKENHLSDKELQSLFLGLVRVVKNSAVAEVSSALKDQCNLQSIEIRNLIKKMNTIKDELNESQRENSKLKKELELLKMDKVNNYANFLQNLKNKQENKNQIKN